MCIDYQTYHLNYLYFTRQANSEILGKLKFKSPKIICKGCFIQILNKQYSFNSIKKIFFKNKINNNNIKVLKNMNYNKKKNNDRKCKKTIKKSVSSTFVKKRLRINILNTLKNNKGNKKEIIMSSTTNSSNSLKLNAATIKVNYNNENIKTPNIKLLNINNKEALKDKIIKALSSNNKLESKNIIDSFIENIQTLVYILTIITCNISYFNEGYKNFLNHSVFNRDEKNFIFKFKAEDEIYFQSLYCLAKESQKKYDDNYNEIINNYLFSIKKNLTGMILDIANRKEKIIKFKNNPNTKKNHLENIIRLYNEIEDCEKKLKIIKTYYDNILINFFENYKVFFKIYTEIYKSEQNTINKD